MNESCWRFRGGGVAGLVLMAGMWCTVAGLRGADGEPVMEVSGTLTGPGVEPVVFAVFGDCGPVLTSPNPELVGAMVKGWEPDFIVAAGDLNYGFTALGNVDWDERVGLRYGEFILGREDHKYSRQTSPRQRFFPVVGNHDTSVGGLGGGSVHGYVDYFVRNAPGYPDRLPTGSGAHTGEVSYYEFDWGEDIHFVMADSDRGRVDPDFAVAQNEWIGRALENSTARWNFVVFHHPAWSSDRVHGSQQWMQGPHLAMADAVFAAHAHVYERLEVDGTPFFTCGLGGRSIYGLAAEPLPETRFRFNQTNGALRVKVSDGGVLCEFMSIGDGALGMNGGVRVDAHVIGDYVPVNRVDEHAVAVVAGQELVVEGAVAGELKGVVEWVAPGGEVVAEAVVDAAVGGGAVALTHRAEESGEFVLRVRATGEGPGDYTLSVWQTPDLPEDPVEVWRAQWFGFDSDAGISGDFADPDGDGQVNLIECAVGSDPNRANGGPPQRVDRYSDASIGTFQLWHGMRAGLVYAVLVANRPDAEQWSVVGVRGAGGQWGGNSLMTEQPAQDGRGVWLRAAVSQGARQGARALYFRLLVQRSVVAP